MNEFDFKKEGYFGKSKMNKTSKELFKNKNIQENFRFKDMNGNGQQNINLIKSESFNSNQEI